MQEKKITHRPQREAMITLLMEWLRTVHVIYAGEVDNWAGHSDEILVFYAMLMATVAGRWVGQQHVHKLLGMPKATSFRHIQAMYKSGILIKRPDLQGYKVNPDLANAPDTLRALSHLRHMIITTAEKLIKMEPIKLD